MTTFPLFPLPQVVLLPGMVVPLHFFEPRYVQMIEAIMKVEEDDSKAFAMARLLAKDEMDYYLNPEFEEIGCIAQVIKHRINEDGTHDVIVLGTDRVYIKECGGENKEMFRTVEIMPRPYQPDPEALREWLHRKRKIFGERIGDAGIVNELFAKLETDDYPPRYLLNVFTAFIEDDPQILQEYLEDDFPTLQWQLLREWLAVGEAPQS